MKRLNIKMYLLLLLVFVSSCSESLEDTYKDYVGDGRIRYLSRCSDLTVKSGWKRIELKWKNGIDETVSNIKVVWTVNDIASDTILAKDVEYLNITDLEDGTYKFDVYAINAKGEKSMSEVNYGRPYTKDHETVRTFTMAVVKHYKVKNNLIMFMDRWNNNIDTINMTYTHPNGTKMVLPLTKTIFDAGIYTLKDIDVNKDIIIDRRGLLEGCADTIVFEDLKLIDQVNLSSSFKTAIQARYGHSDQTVAGKIKLEEFLATTEELELDYDLESLENILYCSNLKKLVLGKNRYLHSTYSIPASTSSLYDKELSITILDIANELLGLKVDRYSDHYLGEITKPYLTEKGASVLPNITTFKPSDIKELKNSVPEVPGYESNQPHLCDDNISTWWEPAIAGYVREYEINVELNEVKRIDGIKFVQYAFNPKDDKNSQNLLQNLIEIKVSKDKLQWTNVTHVEENVLGRGTGETTLLKMVTPADVKYIRIIMNDQSYSSNYGLKVAEIMPYVNN